MHHKKIKVSIRYDLINRADQATKELTGKDWQLAELTIDEFIDHVSKGFAFCHAYANGRRNKSGFSGASILVADIDDGLTLVEAKNHPFIKKFATFIYTSVRNTEQRNKFRIIFVLERTLYDADSYEALYDALMQEMPSDPSAQSSAQFFFGNTDAEVIWFGNQLPNYQMNQMIAQMGVGIANSVLNIAPKKITPTTLVKVKGRGLEPINVLPARTSIHCPFETHADKHASAFIKINSKGTHGVECKSCAHDQWTQSDLYSRYPFGSFDDMVKDLAGKVNPHFQFEGLTQFDHDIETSLKKSNFHLSNSEKLTIQELFPGIHFIKSPKGSGKTHALAEVVNTFKSKKYPKKYHLDDDDQIILIGHRQSLIRESAEKLGLDCYLDTGAFDTKLCKPDVSNRKRSGSGNWVTKKPKYYAICLDSLSSRIKTASEKYGVVIIDESEQVFSHFLSEHMKRPSSNFEVLSKIIKQAKYVFCLDADLDSVTLTGMISCLSYNHLESSRGYINESKRNFHHLHFYLNDYKSPPRSIEVFTSKNQLQADLLQNLENGKKCYVTSNNKKFVTGLYEAAKAYFKDKYFQLVIADRGDDVQIKHFLRNIKTEILKYDAVFSSPSIGTGIDITFPDAQSKIDVVYGFFETNINTHFDIDQQLGRVRNPGEVKVWISPQRHIFITNKRLIIQELMLNKHVKDLNFSVDIQGLHADGVEHPFMNMLSEVIAHRHKSMNDLKTNFLEYKKLNGWSINSVEHAEDLAQQGSVIGKASKVLRKRVEVQRLLEANDLTFKEASGIQDKKDHNQPLTDVEKAAVQKYWLKHFYKEEVTEDLISLDAGGSLREKIILLEGVLDQGVPYQTYLEFNKMPIVSSNKLTKDQRNRVAFIREVLNIAGLFDVSSLSLRLDYSYGTSNLGNFISYMKTNKIRYGILWEKDLNQHIEERPANQLNAMLKLVGLNQVMVKMNKGGKPGSTLYQINPDQYQFMMNIVTKRGKNPDKTVKID